MPSGVLIARGLSVYIDNPNLLWQFRSSAQSSEVCVSPVAVFLLLQATAFTGGIPDLLRHTGIVVKVVLVILALFSFVSWAIILYKGVSLRRAYSQSVTFLVTEASGLSTVRVTLQDPDQGAANKYQVCFSSPDSSFVSRSGQNVAKGEAGLLKDCADVNPANKPCVVDRFKENGAVVVIITVPPGDPRIKL